MSKLARATKNSTVKKIVLQDELSKNKKTLSNQKILKEYPRSYRLDAEIMNILKETLIKINETSPKKVSETRLLKALILLSKDISKDKITKALKEVW